MPRFLLCSGAVSAALSVALGAFAAHGLKPRLTEDMLAVGIWRDRNRSPWGC